MKSEPSTLITATGVPSSAAATVSPRPGACAEKFAGRITVSESDEVGVDLGAPPRVVPQRDHVCAGGQDPGSELGRDPDAVRRVLAVDDADARAELLAQRAQPFFQGTPARGADDVSDEEDLQRTEKDAAGRTDSDTLLPASCV